MRVLVTGAAGHLGAEIVRVFGEAHAVIGLGRAELDITSRAAVADALSSARPDAVINCAAYNDVDAAQVDPRMALDVNAFGVLALASAARARDVMFVHYSTDFVFDGSAAVPYTETDVPRPRSHYGCTKLLGEYFAAAPETHYVLRVESLFGGHTEGRGGRPGTLWRLLAAARSGATVRVFKDRTVTPSYAPDLALATRHLLESSAAPGLYHAVCRSPATWEELLRHACQRAGIAARFEPQSFVEGQFRAPRPKYCALDPSKLAATGALVQGWREAVDQWIETSAVNG